MELDPKVRVTEPDQGSNQSDDQDAALPEDHADDPVVKELTSLIVPCRRTSRSTSWR
jgi:hypothetical protein